MSVLIRCQEVFSVQRHERDGKQFAQRVRELRGALRQQDFARQIGVDQTTISNWERGIGKPTPDSLVKLANLAHGEARAYFFKEANLVEGKSYAPALHTIPFDRELFIFAIETVNEQLRKRNRSLSDDRKYATLVALFYELCHQTGSRDSDMVDQLLKIA